MSLWFVRLTHQSGFPPTHVPNETRQFDPLSSPLSQHGAGGSSSSVYFQSAETLNSDPTVLQAESGGLSSRTSSS